ncbi:endoribonuclease YbeY [Sporomusaceae bacterium FL31]|nr:endoribonuclease YbeY [Sporomusaceae bacterium FL31]GCE32626.1 endoribonuclease YbeY [Sporomusaceae bacterium]
MIVTPQLEQTLIAVLKKTAELYAIEPHAEVSVVLADDQYIQQLNADYRGKNCPTDVLSFALNEGDEPEVIDGPEEVLLGDIIISLETAIRQADEYGHTLEREIAFLTVHGMLHLLGYDHEAEEDRVEMRREEEAVLANLGINREF